MIMGESFFPINWPTTHCHKGIVSTIGKEKNTPASNKISSPLFVALYLLIWFAISALFALVMGIVVCVFVFSFTGGDAVL